MSDPECINKIFIKDEFPNELTSLVNGIVYVQPNEKYCIKCSHCELNFELITKFTRHCVETHINSSLSFPQIDNISENYQDLFGISEENLNTTEITEICNDPFTNHNNRIKKEQHEYFKSNEIFLTNTNSKSGHEENIKLENINVRDTTIQQTDLNVSNDLKCDICQKQLMSKSGYLRHTKRQKCGIPTIVKIISSYKCNICGKEFSQNRLLKRHELRHQRTDILTCTHCKTEFKEKKNFLTHLKTHSETEKLHKCEICLKDFKTIYKLKCHSISVHTSEPFYKCNQCSAAFHSRYKLKEHKSDLHNGPSKHKCPYCLKLFVRLTDLQVHERIHTGEKPYQCEICGKSFSTIGLLTKHNKRHTNERNHKCDICGKCFFSAPYLRDHMITHTKIKSFSCEVCDSRFTLRNALIKHRKLHSGIKQYVCKLCGKAYAQGSGLYAHMKTHKLAQESTIQ